MENLNNSNSLFGTNIFSKAFQEFDEASFFTNLHNKVKNKSYFQKYKGFKTTILVLSYAFNIASMLTASYAVFWLTNWVTGIVWAAYLVGGIFLFFLEKIKRKSSNEFFQIWFFQNEIAPGWLILSLFCFGISLGSSAFGTRTGTKELSPNPDLIHADSTASAYRNKVLKLEAENAEMEKQRDHKGVIYFRLQSVIKSNKSMIADYNTRILQLDKKLEGKNDLLTGEYQKQVEKTAWILVLITIFTELLFEMCIAYIWYFMYRYYVEQKSVNGIPDNDFETSKNKVRHFYSEPNLTEVMEEIKQLKATIELKKHSSVSPPPEFEPSFSSNGNTQNEKNDQSVAKNFKKPIGFFSERQLTEMSNTPHER